MGLFVGLLHLQRLRCGMMKTIDSSVRLRNVPISYFGGMDGRLCGGA